MSDFDSDRSKEVKVDAQLRKMMKLGDKSSTIEFVSCAIAFTTIVLPVPAGPIAKTMFLVSSFSLVRYNSW